MNRISPTRAVLSICLVLGFRGTAYCSEAGAPIQNNNYRVDLTRTVVTGSTRKIGMGGAFVGLAEGNAAIPDNPAAVAYRPRAFMRPWEFDMVFSALTTTNDDVDNSGSDSVIYGENVMTDVGLMAQYKNFGLGGVSELAFYNSSDLPQNQSAQLLSGVMATGWSFLDDQLALGFSVNPIGARAYPKDSYSPRSFHLKGTGYGGGVIWHPDRGALRFGAEYSSSISSSEDLTQSTSPYKVGNLIAPDGVVVTDNYAAGIAYEWNDFPLWRTRPAIATFDARVFGQSPGDANGTKAFLSQTYAPVGQKTIVTLNTGLEVEAVPRFLRLRAGTYREPSRYDGISPRQHVTGGFEMRLSKRDVWDHRPLAISFAFDTAKRYQVYSFSVWLYTFTVPVPSHSKSKSSEAQGTVSPAL